MFEYIYLLKNFDPDFFSDKDHHHCEFIIPVNETVTGKQADLFETLLHSNNKFSFCIGSNLKQYDKTFIKEEIIQHFVRLLFLPNYLKTNGQHVFFIEPEEIPGNLDLIIDEFYIELKKQGIKITLSEIMDSENNLSPAKDNKYTSIIHSGLNRYLNSSEPESGFETFTKTFTIPQDFGKKWVIPITSLCDFLDKRTRIEKFETWVKNKDPFKVQLIERYNSAIKDNNTIVSENELLKFKLDNSAYYLQLIRKESQGLINEIGSLRLEIHRLTQQILHPASPAGHVSHSMDDTDLIMRMQAHINAETKRANDTFNWYKNEYEILPGWYKKIGQLIKALMGKRSFKSLFKK